MTRLYLLVEGQTEETFVRELLVSHYARGGLYVTPIILSTSPGHKGGVTGYGKVKPQISRLCRQDRQASVSTLLDLYGLPGDFPGKSEAGFPVRSTGEQKANFLEDRLAKDINEPNFIPYFMVHEFEALLFTQPKAFGYWSDSKTLVGSLTNITQAHDSPEQINDDPQNAPSKRIARLMPEYEKSFHGPLIATEIGLDLLRKHCPHFNSWLLRLEALVP